MATDLPPLGKYQPLAQIGSGGFAVVYRALDTSLEREVALKILKPKYLGDPEFVERFFREARTVARLAHPGIIAIYDVDTIDGRAYIAMELAAGSLGDRLAAGPLPWAEALALLRPICEALDYAHGAGLIHRDLKPANILLGKRGQPLISDFGFARATAEPSASLSVSGAVLGTPGYIAPEIWDGQPAGPPADYYALACIAYETLVGQSLFQADTPARAVQAHVVEGPRFPASWPPGVPPAVAEVLAQALRREPERRFKSALAFWGALNGLRAAADEAPQPRFDDSQPRFGDSQPRFGDSQPRFGDSQPRFDDSQPRFDDSQPRFDDSQPRVDDSQPRVDDSQPRVGDAQPRVGDSQPRVGDSQPRRSIFAQVGGQHGCTLAVTLAILLALGGLGSLRLLGTNAAGPAQETAVGAETMVIAGETPVVGPAATQSPEPTGANPPTATAAPLPTIQAAPTPERAWSAEPPDLGRVLERGAGGAAFVAASADKDISPAFANEAPSCIEGIIVAPDGSRVRDFAVELASGAEVRRADHDHLTGTYALCGLEPGDWEVAISAYQGYPADPAERAAHRVRFHTSGTPGEIFYISFQARELPAPAAPYFPPPVASPAPAEQYDGRWEGTIEGMSPFGPARASLVFEVADGKLVYTESSDAPCAWDDNALRATIRDGFSFAGLAIDSGVYYRLAGAFSSPGVASGVLRADVGPGRPCLDEATWSAARVSP